MAAEKRVVSIGNITVISILSTIIGSFFVLLNFSLTSREKEFNRFSEIKPIFETVHGKDPLVFRLKNYGGMVFFVGCSTDTPAGLMKKTPGQFETLTKEDGGGKEFQLRRSLNKGQILTLFWRDADINVYKMGVKLNDHDLINADAPYVKRSDYACSLPRFIDKPISRICPKEWYQDFEVPADTEMVIAPVRN
jgi:hypothetical protein